MLIRLLIESFSTLPEVAGLLWVSGDGAAIALSLWKLLQDEIKMLLIGQSIARELWVALVAIIMLSSDLWEATEPLDRLAVDVHILDFRLNYGLPKLLFANFLLVHLHLLLVFLNAGKDIVNQDIFICGLGWLQGFWSLFVALNFWYLVVFVSDSWCLIYSLSWLCRGIFMWLDFGVVGSQECIFSLLRGRLRLGLGLWFIMNELAPDSIRTIPVQKEFSALLSLIVGWYLSLNHHIIPSMCKWAAISKFAFAIELEVFAHFCSELVYKWCWRCEVVIQGQGWKACRHQIIKRWRHLEFGDLELLLLGFTIQLLEFEGRCV